MPKLDIIIPVGKNDVSFVARVIKYISICLQDIENIYIITSSKHIHSIRRRIYPQYKNCIFINENELIPNLSFHTIDELLKKYSPNKKQNTGWFFQQFLKLAFAQSKYCHSFYLTWDADTLPLAPISFFDGKHILYNPKKEYNPNYFVTIKHLFGYGKKNESSYISENMVFSKEIVCKMLKDIESSDIEGNSWIEKILSICDFASPLPCFSEFETYGTYCFVNHPDLYKPRYLNTFREAGLICGRNISDKKLRIMSFDLDTASFEMQHSPMFPYNLPNFWLKNKNRIHKLTRISIKELIQHIKKKNIKTQPEIENTLYRLPKF